MRAVSSWGRLSSDSHQVVRLGHAGVLHERILGSPLRGLPHGMGRSYGDACLNPGGVLWLTDDLDHFVEFDERTGRLVCEPGVRLRDIQRLMMPRGWCLPVTPGTQAVSVGGAIANDVHGKNHAAMGTFGDHVTDLTLVRTDGQTIECGPQRRAEWFRATVGGLGLTGVIARAGIRLRRIAGPWLDCETIPFADVDDFFALADASTPGWEHTVAWIDCLDGERGRGLFMRANPVDAGPRPAPSTRRLALPFVPPVSLVNRLSLQPFNALYYHLKRLRADRGLAHYESYFYPLDGLRDWNRMYGPKGFYQYQCVVPRPAARDAIRALLREIGRSGEGSFLSVLKTFGEREPAGLLSFPMPGATLALDFPNQGPRTLALFDRLDAIVRDAGGRLYPAKDARMSRAMFEAGYPALDAFARFRDPGISSGLSRRLMGV